MRLVSLVRPVWKGVLLLSLLVGLYLFRFYTLRPIFKEGDRVRVTGTLSEDPVVVNGRARLVVGVLSLFVDRFPEYHYGDRIVVEGEVTQGKRGWYLREVERVEKVEEIKSGWWRWLRGAILDIYRKYLPEPHAALLSGIVLGTKSGLNSEFVEGLIKTGTLHIVVASGSNIALLGGGILNSLAYFIRRSRAVVVAVLAIWFYVLLVGWEPPILRAAIMGSIAFIAQALGREADAWRALFISAVALLLIYPLWLFDAGFQLSFAATAGIITFYSKMADKLAILPAVLKETLATTLAAQIAVSPILIFRFGQLSLISLLVNVLVVPTVPFIMGGGMLIGLVGQTDMISPIVQVLFWFVWLPLEYFVRVVSLFSRLP